MYSCIVSIPIINMKNTDGLMSSVVSFSAFIMVSVYGNWVDRNGNKYRTPYTCTFILGMLGNLIYFMAIVMPKGGYLIYFICVWQLYYDYNVHLLICIALLLNFNLIAIGFWAINTMMVGRFITGMAGAGRTLSYTYVSSVVPQGKKK